MNNRCKDKEQKDNEGDDKGVSHKKEIVHSPLADFFSFGWLTALQYTKVLENKYKAILLKLLIIIILALILIGISIISYVLFN